MTVRVLFSAPRKDWRAYMTFLPAALAEAGVEAEIEHELMPDRPETVDYIVYAPSSKLQDFSYFTGAKAVLNLWAGVEEVVQNVTLTQPLARMVDPGLTEGMIEWCVGHVMRHHLGIDRDLASQNGVWEPRVPPLARNRRVSILGLGALGAAVAQALVGLGFPVTGWSRAAKELPGIACRSGDIGLIETLHCADILILLLPLTEQTDTILNATRFAELPAGAHLLNPGRGGLISDDDLIAALDTDRLAHATLDVFRQEPLPPEHPFWRHPKVTVTPHIASATRPETAARVLAENVRRGEAGEPFLHVVDRDRGY